MTKVSLVKGDDRTRNVRAALELISDEIVIPDRPVMVKPNFVSTKNQLCATHVDATRATLEFLQGRGVSHFTIAVGPALGTPDEGFDNYGYRPLADEFDVTFFDLNTDESVDVPAFDATLGEQTLKMSKALSESYVVSVAPMKTHNDVVVTLGLKNILVGTLCGRSEKEKIHKGSPAINLTLAKMAQHVAPDLTVIDGTVGMQGNGPISGFEIDSQLVVASAHAIAADVIGLQVMGFRLDQVGYIRYAMELRGMTVDDIEVVGETVEDCLMKFQPHENIATQLKWPVKGDWRVTFDRVS